MTLSRSRLQTLLGVSVKGAEAPHATWEDAETFDGGLRQRFRISGSAGPDIRCVFLHPDRKLPGPAVLYCHAHGNRYEMGADELLEGRPALQAPYGPALLRHGIASLSIDLAPFGARQAEGPEGALAKAAHWAGRTMMGEMLNDLSRAFDLLAARPEVDTARIATLGLSMGATHAYWLAALRPEVAAVAHLCAFSNIAPLITGGGHDLHGPYMTVPGLLAEGDMGDVAALIAPRPQLICAGGLDPLTPAAARDPAVHRVRRAYGAEGNLQVVVEPAAGHSETPRMRAAVLQFLTQALRP